MSRLADGMAFRKSEHFAELAVVAPYLAIAGEQYADRGIVHDRPEFAQRRLQLFLGLPPFLDVLADPDDAAIQVSGIDRLGKKMAPDQAAVLAPVLRFAAV